MKQLLTMTAIFLTVLSLDAYAEKKSCEELKMEIAAKIDAKGVKNYELKIVTPEEVKTETVVGSCEGGTKRIIYTRK